MIMSDFSFCKNCGGYISPESVHIYFDNEGRPGALCDNCSNGRIFLDLDDVTLPVSCLQDSADCYSSR
jgi:hypothetical protein